MLAGYVYVNYSCYVCIHQYILHIFWAFIFHQIETEVLKWSKYTKCKIFTRIFKANLLYLRVRESYFHTITFQTKRNKWIVPGISSMAYGKPRRCLQSNQTSFHEETAPSKTVHASNLHVTCLSFPFCRMVVFCRSTSKIRLKITLYALSASCETG